MHLVVACSLLTRCFLQRARCSKVANSVCSGYVFVISNTSYMPMTQKLKSPAKILPQSSGPSDPAAYSAAPLDVCWLPKSRPREPAHLNHATCVQGKALRSLPVIPCSFQPGDHQMPRPPPPTPLHSGSSHSLRSFQAIRTLLRASRVAYFCLVFLITNTIMALPESFVDS